MSSHLWLYTDLRCVLICVFSFGPSVAVQHSVETLPKGFMCSRSVGVCLVCYNISVFSFRVRVGSRRRYLTLKKRRVLCGSAPFLTGMGSLTFRSFRFVRLSPAGGNTSYSRFIFLSDFLKSLCKIRLDSWTAGWWGRERGDGWFSSIALVLIHSIQEAD